MNIVIFFPKNIQNRKKKRFSSKFRKKLFFAHCQRFGRMIHSLVVIIPHLPEEWMPKIW